MSNAKNGSGAAALLSAEDETELARRIEAGVLARELLARELVARELVGRGLAARGSVPENPLPENPLPENPLPENPLPENPLPENPLPENPLPDGTLPDNTVPPDSVGAAPPLDGIDASTEELRWLVRDGELAQRRFVQANLRLVSMVAGQFSSRMGDGRTELFQEGCVGLLLAVQRFDHRRGCRFATYALFWIRAVVGVASARSRGAADLPARRAEELRGLRGLEGELAQRFGRSATVTELAEAAGRSTDWVAGMVAYEAPQSLDHLGEIDLPDPSSTDPAETVGVSARPGRELLWHLGPLERQILELRMGFCDGRPHSYAEVSRHLGLPVARVRRTELRALERLRAVCPQEAVLHL